MAGKINWKPTKKDLFKFGLTILIGFGIIGVLAYHKGAHHRLAVEIWLGAISVFVLSVFLPAAAKPVYWVWMAIGMVIGAVMSRVVMTLIFYLVLTPVAILFKLLRRDALNRRKKSGAPTYWNSHPEIKDKSYYEHLF